MGIILVTSPEKESTSKRLFFSTIFLKQMQIFCVWQEKALVLVYKCGQKMLNNLYYQGSLIYKSCKLVKGYKIKRKEVRIMKKKIIAFILF